MSATADSQGTVAPPLGRTRLAAVALLVLALGAVAFVILRSSGDVTVHAHFENASGLVTGGEVRVAGRKVGSISAISLTPAGQADLELEIDGDHSGVLREGMRAAVRAVGQAGITNKYVALTPGPPDAPELKTGAVLATDHTRSAVALDALLDTFDPAARADLRQLIANGSKIYAGSGSRYFNGMLERLDPALAEINGLTGQVASDRASLRRLVKTSAAAAEAIGSRSADLRSAVSNTARSLGAVAEQQDALSSLLRRTPATLRQARGTLARLTTSASALRPTLRAVPAAAKPLDAFLHELKPALDTATPVVQRLNQQLPGLRESLRGLVAIKRPGVAALEAAREAMRTSMPILNGLRIYAPDLFVGVFNGIIQIATGAYDNGGQYAHAEFVQPPQTFFEGAGATIFSSRPLIPGFFGIKTHQDNRCPGSLAPPAPDGSSPWVPDPSLCDPSQNLPSSINEP